jgi:hypothetical protein
MFFNFFIKMKKKPFFPKAITLLSAWAHNYKTKIVIYASALEISDEELATEIAICDKIIDSINDVIGLKAGFKSGVNNRNDIINVDGTNLRLDIKRHKSAAGYTDAIGLALGIIGTDTEFDPNTYKPVITVEPFGNLVNIRFTKNGVNGINIYTRKKGDTNFKLLSRATKSPFKYQPAIDDSGKPIQWEFIAFGVIRDEEIGLPSDSVTFVFSQQTEA